MNLFENVATAENVVEEKDSVGGFGPLESGVYAMKVAMAYLLTSKKGAVGVALQLEGSNGEKLRQTIYVTSGADKGCKTFYTKDGEQHALPGFSLMNSLALLGAGEEILKLPQEEKLVNVYNFDTKKEEPTKVPVLMDLLDKEVLVAVQKQTVDKTVLSGGEYLPTGEFRDVNEIDKVFRARDGMTVAEIRAGAEEATFIETWKAKWTGVTRDRRSKDGAKVATGSLTAGGSTAAKKPTQSLFA